MSDTTDEAACACRRLRDHLTDEDLHLLRDAHDRHEEIHRHRRYVQILDRYLAVAS